MVKIDDLTIKIGGQAGDGSLATGEVLAKAYKKMGLNVATDKDFPSRIRGGHTSYTIRGAKKPVYSIGDNIDVLLAFDEDSIKIDLTDLVDDGILIFDNSKMDLNIQQNNFKIYKIPLANMAKTELGLELIKNTLALGVIKVLFDLDANVFKDTIKEMYSNKGAKIIDENIKAFELGETYANAHFEKVSNYKVQKYEDSKERMLIMGNEAIGIAAIIAGCRFIAAYPITPASDILEYMARFLPEQMGVAIQAEVEIAAVNMAIGASYAGARAMTVTSGPGLDLKTEAIGLAGMIETPLVIVEAQRAGPSTGMPTKTEQSDINHVTVGGHGEIPRIVIVPGTVEEAFYFTVSAFNFADKYQCPVIILTYEIISWNKQTTKRFDLDKLSIDRGKLLLNIDSSDREFKRYSFQEDGISPRPIPTVKNGIHLETGDEHDEYGHITERVELRNRMMQKRMHKLDIAAREMYNSVTYGEESENIVIGIGSTKGPILEAMEYLKTKQINLKYIRIRTLWPFPAEELKGLLKNAKRIFVVENNYTAQLATLLKSQLGSVNIISILKYDGRAFKPKDIYNKIEEVIRQ
jgi:2-oxoglutarate ferredoxin oxidoreductase subunit alpha